MPRVIRWAAVGVVLALVTVACGSSSSGPQPIVADVARAEPGADEAATAAAVDALVRLGSDLQRRLASEAGDTDVVVSPYSVAVALAMVSHGARGATRTELEQLLGLDEATTGPVYNTLAQTISSRERDDLTLRLATGFWASERFDADPGFAPEFVEAMTRWYGAPIEVAPMDDPDRVEADINDWARQHTDGMIDPLIEPGTLAQIPDPIVTFLLNAIHLDARWATTFDPGRTGDAPFTTLSGDEVSVEMMNRGHEIATPYAEGPDWQAVELTYVGEELGMVLILPAEGAFGAVRERFGAVFAEAEAALADEQVGVYVPKFSIETSASLSESLEALGLSTAFSPAADLSGVLRPGGPGLYVSEVYHGARIEVDEQGTRASAATGLGAYAVSGPLVTFRADRPFLFVLRDRELGVPLFMGQVTELESGAG